MARKPIFDTSVFSDYADEVDRIILSILFPTVVLYELIATSIDDSTLARYQRWRGLLNTNNCLINPTATDWWETGKAVRRLYMMKGRQRSKLRKLRNDALMARLAVVRDGFVVSHDVDDFGLIQKVMPDLKVMSARDFFQS